MFLANSTLSLYNRELNKIRLFCAEYNVGFPPSDDVFAKYLLQLVSHSSRPESILKSTMAAIGHVCEALGVTSPVNDQIRRLVRALIKSSTSRPLSRTKIMPIAPFYDLFMSWLVNEKLTIQKLRQKAITLLALAVMARPSDLAPLGRIFDPDASTCSRIMLTTDQLTFNPDGSLTMVFFGIKNDSHRTGFEIRIPAATNALVDPVRCLKCYIQRTDTSREHCGPVFISLNHPFSALTNTSISRILSLSITDAGLEGQGYSPRCFRPTAATVAVRSGCDPGLVRQIGRWKTESVFYERYVYPVAPSDFTNRVISSTDTSI
jgi:hypothetical protein